MKQLDSLEIIGFRAFEHLKIEELGQINLIVGKNSVGKTALLEAIEFYGQHSHAVLWQQLTKRQEGGANETLSPSQKLQIARLLFYGRPDLTQVNSSVEASVGPLNEPYKKAVIDFKWQQDGDDFLENTAAVPTLTVRFNEFPITDRFDQHRLLPVEKPLCPILFISSAGLSAHKRETLWGEVVLTSRKQAILNALQLIIPNLEDIAMIGKTNVGLENVVAVKLKNLDYPLPLEHFGEGATRLFNLILAIVSVAKGILLIDEIESGFHYSIVYKIWQTLFFLAQQQQVQLFVTTHSDDCVDTFLAAAEDSPLETRLIRLENRQSHIVPILYNQEVFSLVVEEKIEVR
jgi:predicted ATPase